MSGLVVSADTNSSRRRVLYHSIQTLIKNVFLLNIYCNSTHAIYIATLHMPSILGVGIVPIVPTKFSSMYSGKMDAERFYFLKDTQIITENTNDCSSLARKP